MGIFFVSAHAQMPDSFTTQRVYAERIDHRHADDLFKLFSDPQVQESYGVVREHVSRERSLVQVTLAKKHWEDYGFGSYVLFHKDTHEFLGLAGLYRDILDGAKEIHCSTYEDVDAMQGTEELEIFYLYMPIHWRHGYGYEVAKELTQLAFVQLPYSSIIAYILPDNAASHGLIQKMGFKEEGTVFYKDNQHILYRLNKN